MQIMARKVFREIIGMKWKAFVVILSFALAIGVYAGLLLMQDSVFASRDALLDDLNYEDFRVSFLGDMPQQLVDGVSKQVTGLDEMTLRLTEDIVIKKGDTNHFARLTGIKLTNDQPSVNQFYYYEGRGFKSNSTEILITKSFANHQNISLGDTVLFKFNQTSISLKVVGIVFSPEYKYDVNPVTGIPEKGTFAAIWMDLGMVQSIFAKKGLVNEAVVTVKEGEDKDVFKSRLIKFLDKNGVPANVIAGTEEADYRTMETDVNALEDSAIAIGIVVLFVAAAVIYDTITKIVKSQKQMIGLFLALGSDKRKIMVHYMEMAIIMTGLGILFSIPLGYVTTYQFTSVYNDVVGLPKLIIKFNLTPFEEPLIIALAVTLFASLTATRGITRMKPVEALEDRSIPFNISGRFSLDKLITNRISKNYLMRIPIRHVLYRRKRTIATAITISIASLLALSALGFMDSMFKQIDDFYTYNVKYDYEVTLVNPINESHFKDVIKNYDSSIYVEQALKEETILRFNGKNESAIFEAYKENTKLRKFNFFKGSLEKGKIAIGKVLAERLGVNVGDKITLALFNYRNLTMVEHKFEVSGITEELLDISVFMHLDEAKSLMGLDGGSRTYLLKADKNEEKLTDDLLNLPIGVQSVLCNHKSKESINYLLEAMLGFILTVVFIGFIVLGLFSINVVVVDTIEREREFVNIRANGGNRWHILKIIATQIYLIAIITIALDFVIVPPTTKFLIDQTAKDFMSVKMFIKLLTYIYGAIVTFAGLFVGVWMAVRYVIKLILAIVIRIRFES